MVLSVGIGAAIGTLPFLGPAYEDTSGKVDIHMQVSWEILVASVACWWWWEFSADSCLLCALRNSIRWKPCGTSKRATSPPERNRGRPSWSGLVQSCGPMILRSMRPLRSMT